MGILTYFIYESGVNMYEIYKIKEGDTIEGIANDYGTTVGVLRQINGFYDDSYVKEGNQIIVPALKMQPYSYYTVKKGDNMYEIAKDNGVDYTLLLQINGLDDGDYIYPNQTIMVPKKGIELYMTKDNDTFDFVLKKMGVSVDEMMKENKNIFLRPEQILIFREK